MKLKTWKLWLCAAICFIFSGLISLIQKEYLRAFEVIFLAASYFVLGVTTYKNSNRSNKNELSDTDLEIMNNELKNLIIEGKKIKAIKKYRILTGVGLKEAKEYVDLLSEKIY